MTETASENPPACERCGVRTYPTHREMRMHQLRAGAVPENKTVPVWRCPACGREAPRS